MFVIIKVHYEPPNMIQAYCDNLTLLHQTTKVQTSILIRPKNENVLFLITVPTLRFWGILYQVYFYTVLRIFILFPFKIFS